MTAGTPLSLRVEKVKSEIDHFSLSNVWPHPTLNKSLPLSESAQKLKTLHDQTNNSLAALLAHVAATAHAAASCVAGSHFYSTYYPQPVSAAGLALQRLQETRPVPIKTQLAKASTTFASLKDKIATFFQVVVLFLFNTEVFIASDNTSYLTVIN